MNRIHTSNFKLKVINTIPVTIEPSSVSLYTDLITTSATKTASLYCNINSIKRTTVNAVPTEPNWR